MSAACHFCGSTAVSPQSRMGSRLCERCLPIQQHVVSMQVIGGEAAALCECGWSMTAPWSYDGLIARDDAVTVHWAEIVAASL